MSTSLGLNVSAGVFFFLAILFLALSTTFIILFLEECRTGDRHRQRHAEAQASSKVFKALGHLLDPPMHKMDFVALVYETDRLSTTLNLVQMLQHHSYPYKLLGMGDKWEGWFGRYLAHSAYINTLPDDTFVLMLDGRDTVINLNYAEFRRRAVGLLKSKGTTVCFGAETNLFMGFNFPPTCTPESSEKVPVRLVPLSYLNTNEHEIPTYDKLLRFLRSRVDSKGMFPNYGICFGTAAGLKQLFRDMALRPGEDDQGIVIKLWYETKSYISIDFDNEIFESILATQGHTLRWDWNARAFMNQNNTFPSIIHFPGKNEYYKGIAYQALSSIGHSVVVGHKPENICKILCCNLPSPPQIQVVISRYMEDLSWVDDLFYSEDIIIYNKGSPLKGTIPLQNRGRDFHSYFFHIVENFSTLADITFFVPGSAFKDTEKRRRMLRVLKIARTTRNSVILCSPLKTDIGVALKDFQISTYVATNAQNKKANPEGYLRPAAHRPFGNWFRHKFSLRPTTKYESCKGIMAIHKQHIQQHGIEVYRQLCRDLEDHSNPEDLHYIERAVPAIFAPIPEACYLPYY